MKSSISRAAVLIGVASTVALAGCSSSGTTDTASSSAPTSSAASSPSASSDPTSSDTASAPASSAPASTAPELIAVAKKLGCSSPTAPTPKSDSPAYKMGVRHVLQCKAGSIVYFLASATPSQQDQIAKAFVKAGAASTTSSTMSYASAPGWMAIGGGADTKTLPSKKDAAQVQAKVGGTVKTAS
ncbi:hypothetical protein [Leekyejoonella antrihumi]|uniref:DUF3558 domain-containing protein n=1 Tax=Leekyejoonella antrihumi TaxID=1660198 RepID=A0A563E6W4_9MICO|nr:hypothetical protein [Leekyejoonella antrihumi]TWP37952.1 hypothetical protein FGL98_04380 [Leekyejoonella antrihumi]